MWATRRRDLALALALVLLCVRNTIPGAFAQIPWGSEFDHETARELFGSNLLALTAWIKGDPMPIHRLAGPQL